LARMTLARFGPRVNSCRFRLRARGGIGLEDSEFAVQQCNLWFRLLYTVLGAGSNRGNFLLECFQLLCLSGTGASDLLGNLFECGLCLWQSIGVHRLGCLRRAQQTQQKQGQDLMAG
jgi:hypothetical protein